MTDLGLGSGPRQARFVDGLNRVKRAPWLVIGVWLSTLAAGDAAGDRPAGADRARTSARAWPRRPRPTASTTTGGTNSWRRRQASAPSFVPAILGFAAVMKNLSTVADATAMPTVIAIAVAMYLLVSLFLAGGVIDRLARDRDVGAGAFFSGCGVYFVRFIRLGVIARRRTGCSSRLHAWLFDAVYPALTRTSRSSAPHSSFVSVLRYLRVTGCFVQHPVRLREDSRRRRRSPQHDRRGRRELAVHYAAPDGASGRSTPLTCCCS